MSRSAMTIAKKGPLVKGSRAVLKIFNNIFTVLCGKSVIIRKGVSADLYVA